MKLTTLTILTVLVAPPVFAAGTHGGGHDMEDSEMMMDYGRPGSADEVDRTINIAMRETDDGAMLFEPNEFSFKQGETIRFNVTNKGELEHEFVIDTMKGNAKHKKAMAMMNMEHDDPNSVRLDPGKSGEVIWKFANTGNFEFACLIPGHYESGMHGPIKVGSN